MNIEIIAIGNIKEKYLKDGIQEYAKRLSAYCQLTITEVAESKLPQNASDAEIAQAIEKEGEAILAKLPKQSKVVTLCIEGKQSDSETFAENLEKWALDGGANITFVIGGSNGLSEEVKKISQKISFSKMTFPHQLMRMILLEQIYRGFRILRNEPYHK